MSERIGWFWPTVCGLAAGFAVLVSGSRVATLVAGAFAVWAGGMAVARALGWKGWDELDLAVQIPEQRVGVRDLFLAGRAGREDLVLRLDALDRHRGPPRSPQELARILGAPPEVFLRYLAHRVGRIEGTR